MFLEQVLHIMLDQDCSRSLCYFRPQMYELLHYAILGEMENMGKKLCKRLQSHRLNPLNNARFPMSYAVLNLTFCYVYAISKSLQMVCMKWYRKCIAAIVKSSPLIFLTIWVAYIFEMPQLLIMSIGVVWRKNCFVRVKNVAIGSFSCLEICVNKGIRITL